MAIASATSLDVIEMDAASNNSVDDIRELRESVQFAPVSGRSKVYILDEAHMLSSQAWNAFLKTLEEPPPNTIFVLATTEAQKVLPTVVDRCHRFDFARPTVEQIAAVITRVAAAESIEIAPDAVALLARHATGSFRDALGTLEQLVTYTGTNIATEDVLAVLGVADADLLFEAFDAVAAGDARAAWLAAARLADTGRDIAQFLKDLEAHARDLLVVQTLGEVPARAAPDPRSRRAPRRAGRARPGLEPRAPARPPGRGPAHGQGRRRRAHAPGGGAGQGRRARGRPRRPRPDGARRAPGGRAARRDGRAACAATAASRRGADPAPPAPAPTASLAAIHGARARAGTGSRPPARPRPPLADEPDLDAVRTLWPAVLDAVRADNGLLAACLAEAHPVEVRGSEVVVAFAEHDTFNRKMADGREHRATVDEALRGLAGSALRVVFELRELERGAREAQPPSEDELVARFKTEFDAEEIVPDDPQPDEPEGRPDAAAAEHAADAQAGPEDAGRTWWPRRSSSSTRRSRPRPAAGWSPSRSPATSWSSRSRSTPEAIDPDDPELLQDMVLAATNEALRAAQELQQTRLGGLAGGMDLGSLGLPGF